MRWKDVESISLKVTNTFITYFSSAYFAFFGGDCMLMIQDLTIKTLEQRILIEHLNLSLTKNDKIAIIGEEGNGKSTLLKGIVNPEWIHDFASMEGIITTGNDVVGYLPQMLDVKWNESSVLSFCCARNQWMKYYRNNINC